MKLSDLSLKKQGVLIVGVPAAINLFVIASLCLLLGLTRHEMVAQSKTCELMLASNEFMGLVVRMVMANYLCKESSGILGAEYFSELTEEAEKKLALLQNLGDTGPQKPKIDKLAGLNKELGEDFRRVQAAEEHAEGVAWQHKAMLVLQEMQAVVEDIVGKEMESNFKITGHNKELRNTLRLSIALSVALSAALGSSLLTVYRIGITNRLRKIVTNSKRVGLQQPLLAPVGGMDEIARLDARLREVDAAVKESIDKDRLLLNEMNDLVVSLDRDLCIRYINPASIRIIGRATEGLIGQNMLQTIPEPKRESANRELATTIGGKEIHRFECPLLKKDGTPLEMLWSVQWSRRQGELFCVIHDISERKKVDKIKEQIVQMVSHDLRSPLTSLDLTLDTLSQGVFGDLPEDSSKEIERIRRNVARLKTLVNDLLDFEKTRSGVMLLEVSQWSVKSLIERSIESVDMLAQKRRVTIINKANDLSLSADMERLSQVLVNLLANAISFSPEGGTIELSVKREARTIKFSVSDQGPGVAPEHHEKIFRPFEQAPDSTSDGAGLGLSICKAIVDAHGGTIGVNSATGEGSTFWFSIPA